MYAVVTDHTFRVTANAAEFAVKRTRPPKAKRKTRHYRLGHTNAQCPVALKGKTIATNVEASSLGAGLPCDDCATVDIT